MDGERLLRCGVDIVLLESGFVSSIERVMKREEKSGREKAREKKERNEKKNSNIRN